MLRACAVCFAERKSQVAGTYPEKCTRQNHDKGGLPQMLVPQNGWFTMISMKMDDLGYFYFRKPPIGLIGANTTGTTVTCLALEHAR